MAQQVKFNAGDIVVWYGTVSSRNGKTSKVKRRGHFVSQNGRQAIVKPSGGGTVTVEVVLLMRDDATEMRGRRKEKA